MLRRPGAKWRFSKKIVSFFKKDIHTFIDIFFGTGAITYEMIKQNKASMFIANDIDENISDFFIVLKTKEQELIDCVANTIIHNKLYDFYKNGYTNDVEKVAYFLVCNQVFLRANSRTLCANCNDAHNLIFKLIKDYVAHIRRVYFFSKDFKEFLLSICKSLKSVFYYADPPYSNIKNINRYKEHNKKIVWDNDNITTLLTMLLEKDKPFAVSEYKNEYTLQFADRYKLKIHDIGTHKRKDKIDTEILLTNY